MVLYHYLFLVVVVILFQAISSEGGDVDALIGAIEKEAEASLGSDQKAAFEQDVILTQTETGYVRSDGGKKGAVVFKRKSGDDGKAIIVLKGDEDHLPKTEDKRTFVVLRQTFDNPKNYWVIYAYVRDATADTAGVADISGGKRLIEFDFWDHRGHYGNEANTFGWSICHSSSFIPCRVDGTGSEINVMDEIKTTETDEADYPEAAIAAESTPSTLPKFAAVTTKGFSVAANYDLFADLEDDALQAMFFGKSIRATAIGEAVLEAAKPTLHALFRKLAPAVDPQVGADVPVLPASGTVDVPAAVAKAKAVSQTLSQVTQEFLKQLGVVGLISDPLLTQNKTLTPEVGRLIGISILKGLLNMKPNLGPNGKQIHPNPALMVDNDVLTQMVGGGVGPLQVAIQLQGPEAVAIQNLFQKPAGLSALFDEAATSDISAAMIPILTGAIKSLPQLPALPVLNSVLPLDKITRLDLVKDELSNTLTGLGDTAKSSATKMATGTMEEKTQAAQEAAAGMLGALTKTLGNVVALEAKSITSGLGSGLGSLSTLTSGLGLGSGILGGAPSLLGSVGGMLSSFGSAPTKIGSVASGGMSSASSAASSAMGMFGSVLGKAKGPSTPTPAATTPKKFGFFRRSVENVNYGFADDIDLNKRSVRKVIDDVFFVDLGGDESSVSNFEPHLSPRRKRESDDEDHVFTEDAESIAEEEQEHVAVRQAETAGGDAAAPPPNVMGNAIGGLFGQLGNAAAGFTQSGQEQMIGAGATGAGLLGSLGGGLQSTFGGLGSTVSGLAGGVESTLSGATAGVSTLLSGLQTGTVGGAGQILQGDVVGGVGSVVGGATAGVSGAGVQFGGGVFNLGSGLGTGLMQTGQGLGETVVGGLGSFKNGLGGLFGRKKREVFPKDKSIFKELSEFADESRLERSTSGRHRQRRSPEEEKETKEEADAKAIVAGLGTTPAEAPAPPPVPDPVAEVPRRKGGGGLLGIVGGLLGRRKRRSPEEEKPKPAEATPPAAEEKATPPAAEEKAKPVEEKVKPVEEKATPPAAEEKATPPAAEEKAKPSDEKAAVGKDKEKPDDDKDTEDEKEKDPKPEEKAKGKLKRKKKVKKDDTSEPVKKKISLLGGLGGLLGRRRRSIMERRERFTRSEVDEDEEVDEENAEERFPRSEVAEDEEVDEENAEERFPRSEVTEDEEVDGENAEEESEVGVADRVEREDAAAAPSALGGILSGIGSSIGVGDAGGLLSGLSPQGGLAMGLGGTTGFGGGLLSGLTGGAIGAQVDDGSFSSMAKDAAATALTDKLLGEGDKGPTSIGETIGSGLGGKLDSVLPTGGMLGSMLGKAGSMGDSTFGTLGKAAFGNVARQGMKGAVKGAINSGAIGQMRRRKRAVAAPAPVMKVMSKSNADLFAILGWTGLDSKDDAAHASETHGFIGFGPCAKISGDAYGKVDGMDGDSAVVFYLSLLRVQCLESKMKEVKELLNKKYLEISGDKYFTVPSGLDVLKKRKLTVEEATLLSRALEFASFSQVIVGQLKKEPAPELRDTVALNMNSTSPTSLTMMRFGIRFLSQTKAVAPTHFVKLTRHMAKTFKSALTKSVQDYAVTAFSTKYTPEEKQGAFDNVFHLAGMIHFYVNGLNPIHNGEDIIPTLDLFLKANDKEIYKRALLYCSFDV